ncbi:MAG: 2-hydroxychromene-2-carboxylate isomerase [Nevskiales bacterium]
MMTTKTIELFWDCGSPYTYLASTQIEQLAQECGADLRWRPFLLGGAFQATGNRMPAAIPAKGKYLFDDVKLWAKFYGVAFRFPDQFPINTLAAQRAGVAADRMGKGAAFAKRVMRAHFGEGRDVSQPDELKACAVDVGLDAEALLAQTQEQAVKDELKSNTEEAVRRGAFGAPTFFVGEQMFWGNDRLDLMRAWLKGKLS